MNLSRKWLNEFVNLEDISTKELCSQLTLTGSKVETFEVEGGKIDNVVVGKVVAIEKHPNADKLLICQVDVGQGAPLQIVTGAQNLKVSDIVPVALDGSTLYDSTKIKKGKFRGLLSCGMLCSLREVGLTINDFPEAVEDGIFVLNEALGSHYTLGENFKEAIGFNDTKIEFEITPNRPDCMSVIGLAREAGATFGKPLKQHTPVVKGEKKLTKKLSVNVVGKNICPYYSARVIENVKVAHSPKWIRERLRVMGVKPVNNIVDITNYVMLEYGQPLHAFDLDCISGGQINVRLAKENEKITTLDGASRDLTGKDLVIADDTKPVAIAGVMGGKNSKIMKNTTTIVLESANFAGPSIRATSKRLNLRTDSSALFEKGLDPFLPKVALDRACELIEELGIGEVTNEIFAVDSVTFSQTVIPLDCSFINSFLNIDLSKEQMGEILKKIGCEIKEGNIYIPSYRSDLKLIHDIAEEIARFYGYNNIPSTALKTSSVGKLTSRQKFEKKIKSIMLAQGASEVMTFTFMSPKTLDKLMIPAESKSRNFIKIKNPLGEETSAMRTVAMGSILEVLSNNEKHKNQDVKLFEIAKEYFEKEGDNLAEEKKKLIAGFYSEDVDFFFIKGIVEELLLNLKIKDYDVEAFEGISYYHPGRCAAFLINGDIIGVLGEVHPAVLKNYSIKQRVYAFEFYIDDLFKASDFDVEYTPIPKYPNVERDLALICNVDAPALGLQKIIKKAAGRLLESIRIFDVYMGEQVPDGKKSIAFNLSFRSKDSTLADAQIKKIMEKIIATLERENITLRERNPLDYRI
ncbi:MAG: phenylalanine--tRNA ligase subunit beta [Clostridia bacterium]|nr:phenylalanine--tRNA ligase subunit beta [Clostridia bacterium]